MTAIDRAWQDAPETARRAIESPVVLNHFASGFQDLSEAEFVTRFPEPFIVIVEPPAEEGRPFETTRIKLIRLREGLAPDGARVVSMPSNRRPLRVGRARLNDIAVRSIHVSKVHCYLKQDTESGATAIIDPGSSNGTTVNGVRLQAGFPWILIGGEAIWLAGVVRLEFQSPSAFYQSYIKKKPHV